MVSQAFYSNLKIANQESEFSIYGGEFADESFEIKHTEPGLLGMAKRNGIADTNQCQFYVTLGQLPFLDN